jgi:hypothetical protein
MLINILKKTLLPLLIILLISCGEEGTNSHYSREVTQLGLRREVVVLTNADGLMVDSATYIDGKIDGLRIKIDESDSIHYFHQYTLGVLDGEQFGFYPNTRPYFTGIRRAGIQVGEWVFYHPNGVTGSYEYYDEAGIRLYLRKYDDKGKVTTSVGKGIFSFERVAQDSTFATGEYRAEITCAHPPNTEVLLFCGDTVSNQMYYLDVQDNRAIYSEIFINSGDYDRLFIWGCEDTVSNVITKSRIEHTIAVLVDSTDVAGQ